MGRHHVKDVLANHLKDTLFHLVHWLIITLFLRKTSQESINLERKSYLDCSLDTHCMRREFGRVTYWSQTLRSWKRWSHRKYNRKDSIRKEVIFHKEKGEFIFPAADGRIEPPGMTVWSNGLISLYFCEEYIEITSIWSKSLARYIPWTCIKRGRIWNGVIMIADIEELEEMDASEIHTRRLNAKVTIFYSQSQMEQSKLLEEIDA